MKKALTLGSPWKQWTWIPSAEGLMASQVFPVFPAFPVLRHPQWFDLVLDFLAAVGGYGAENPDQPTGPVHWSAAQGVLLCSVRVFRQRPDSVGSVGARGPLLVTDFVWYPKEISFVVFRVGVDSIPLLVLLASGGRDEVLFTTTVRDCRRGAEH